MDFEPRFGKAATTYSAFRPEYPSKLYERILAAAPPERRDRAMDLGAGTGISTRPLCRWFREVIAVDPDAEMAKGLSGLADNIVVRTATAEECIQEPGTVDLVASGTAFHWMDGPHVLSNIDCWLREGGALAIFSYRFPGTPATVQAVIQEEFDRHWDQYRHDRLRDEDHARRTVLAVSERFQDMEEIQIPYVVQFSPRQLAGFFASTSYGAAYIRTLENSNTYLEELETRFRNATTDDMIPVDFPVGLIQARKR